MKRATVRFDAVAFRPFADDAEAAEGATRGVALADDRGDPHGDEEQRHARFVRRPPDMR